MTLSFALDVKPSTSTIWPDTSCPDPTPCPSRWDPLVRLKRGQVNVLSATWWCMPSVPPGRVHLQRQLMRIWYNVGCGIGLLVYWWKMQSLLHTVRTSLPMRTATQMSYHDTVRRPNARSSTNGGDPARERWHRAPRLAWWLASIQPATRGPAFDGQRWTTRKLVLVLQAIPWAAPCLPSY